jgi:hypothetical protein
MTKEGIFGINAFFGGGEGSESCPSSKDIIRFSKFPHGYSETFPSFVNIFPSRIVPPPGVPLRQIQFVVILMSSEIRIFNLK